MFGFTGGTDQVMENGYDTFGLVISDSTGKKWFPDFESGPKIRDFKKEWLTGAMAKLLEPPRLFRFFTDCSLQRAIHGDETILGRCGALEISSQQDPAVRMFIEAEQCNISIWTGDEIDKRIPPYHFEYDPGPY